jgi:hypothetical protein
LKFEGEQWFDLNLRLITGVESYRMPLYFRKTMKQAAPRKGIIGDGDEVVLLKTPLPSNNEGQKNTTYDGEAWRLLSRVPYGDCSSGWAGSIAAWGCRYCKDGHKTRAPMPRASVIFGSADVRYRKVSSRGSNRAHLPPQWKIFMEVSSRLYIVTASEQQGQRAAALLLRMKKPAVSYSRGLCSSSLEGIMPSRDKNPAAAGRRMLVIEVS